MTLRRTWRVERALIKAAELVDELEQIDRAHVESLSSEQVEAMARSKSALEHLPEVFTEAIEWRKSS